MPSMRFSRRLSVADLRIEIPAGPAGTAETLRVMRAVSLRSSRSPAIRIFASRLEASPIAVNAWLRAHWIPTPDPVDVEWIKLPEYRVIEGDFRGDCDDASVFAAAVLLAMGQPVLAQWAAEFQAIRLPRETEFSHVWLRCVRKPDRAILDIDPIVPAAALPISGYSNLMTISVF